jgi:hypothetical protein
MPIEFLMIRPPSDMTEFVCEVAQAAFGDAWIPRLAIELGCEASEDGIRERCSGEWTEAQRAQMDGWALDLLDGTMARIQAVRGAVAGRMEDRIAKAAAARAAAAAPFDAEAHLRRLRETHSPEIAEWLAPLLVDPEAAVAADA